MTSMRRQRARLSTSSRKSGFQIKTSMKLTTMQAQHGTLHVIQNPNVANLNVGVSSISKHTKSSSNLHAVASTLGT